MRKGSGAVTVEPFGVVTEVRDGLIVHQRFFTDRTSALEAVDTLE
jgi:ketosteroid isomerase-like protein